MEHGFHSLLDGLVYSISSNVSTLTSLAVAADMIAHEFPKGVRTLLPSIIRVRHCPDASPREVYRCPVRGAGRDLSNLQRRGENTDLHNRFLWELQRHADLSSKVMGAGVATSPHFPRIQSPYREGKVFFSWADRAPAEILRPRPTPSRVSCQSIAASIGPQQVLVEISLFRQSLFCGSFARRLGFRWTVRNNGSGIGFRLCLTLLPRSPLPFASATFILSNVGCFRSGSAESFLPFPVDRS